MSAVFDIAVERLLSLGDVAELSHVTPQTISRWAQQGRLPSLRTLGGHRRFRFSDSEPHLSVVEWAALLEQQYLNWRIARHAADVHVHRRFWVSWDSHSCARSPPTQGAGSRWPSNAAPIHALVSDRLASSLLRTMTRGR
jgi:excisionase family DNA binding protein